MTTAKQITDELIGRMKQAQKFEIVLDAPSPMRFLGTVPFDVFVSQGKLYCTIYATSYEEALAQAQEFARTLDPNEGP
jgi:hypothetical protein